MNKKCVTVSELLRQLKTMEELGFGEAKVIYMDELSITYNVEEGVHDHYGKKFVVLGWKTPWQIAKSVL